MLGVVSDFSKIHFQGHIRPEHKINLRATSARNTKSAGTRRGLSQNVKSCETPKSRWAKVNKFLVKAAGGCGRARERFAPRTRELFVACLLPECYVVLRNDISVSGHTKMRPCPLRCSRDTFRFSDMIAAPHRSFVAAILAPW